MSIIALLTIIVKHGGGVFEHFRIFCGSSLVFVAVSYVYRLKAYKLASRVIPMNIATTEVLRSYPVCDACV